MSGKAIKLSIESLLLICYYCYNKLYKVNIMSYMNNQDTPVSQSLYSQLKDSILKKILDREWIPGERIPGEHELCRQYKVSRITARQALAELVRMGYLVRKQGSGTYVTIPKIEQSLSSFYSFSEEFKRKGFKPHSKILEFHMMIPQEEIAHKLGTYGKFKEVYYIKRLRYADDIAVALEFSYLPSSLFPGLTKEDIKTNPLYDVMRDKYGIFPINADESIGAVNLDEKESFYLGVRDNSAALQIERFAYNGETCIEYTLGYIRADIFRFHVKLV